jgi:PAS domain S-box-containing protein
MQLASAAQAGIRYWAGRRENRGLLRRLEGETRRYHDLVQGLDATVWEADAQTGRFTFVSRRAEELLGFPVERWLADPDFWAGRVHTDDREYAESGRRRGLREGRDFELEYRVIAADGRVTWIREAVRSVHDAANGLIGLRGLIWNITKRKKVERQLYTAKRELAEQLADMKHLHELSSRLSATLELEPTLEEILGAVMGVLGAVMGDLRLYDAERDELRLAASEGFTAEYLSLIDALPVGQGACGAAFARRERVVIEDVGSDPIYAPYVEAARLGGYQAVFSTPMVDRGGEVLGTIAAYFPEPHRPPERQARLVELYARQATDFVEHARRHRALREAIE